MHKHDFMIWGVLVVGISTGIILWHHTETTKRVVEAANAGNARSVDGDETADLGAGLTPVVPLVIPGTIAVESGASLLAAQWGDPSAVLGDPNTIFYGA